MALHENVNKPKNPMLYINFISPLLCVSPKIVILEKSLRMVSIRGIQNIKSKLEYRNLLNYYP